jgi:hypothetical protein
MPPPSKEVQPVSTRLAPFILGLALLTATTSSSADNQSLANVLPFDLAVCFVKPASVDQPVSAVTLNGLWILAGPLWRECMSDTRVYVPGKSPAFKVTLTVTENGFVRTIDSDGLTAAGKKCIDDAVGKVAPSISPLPPGSKPVTFTEQEPEFPPAAQVRFGLNTFSDVAATVRLAMPSLCSCFEPFKTGADPKPIGLKVKLTADPEKFRDPKDNSVPKPKEVTVGEGPPLPMKTCIADKLTALSYPETKADLQVVVPYEFRFLNAVADSMDVTALPDPAKFSQLDVMDVPRLAAAQLEQARLDATGARYNGLVKQYQELSKTDAKKAHGMLKDLVSSCKQLVAEHDVYIGVLESESKLRQEQLTLATSLKAKDAAWAPAEAAVKKAAADSEALVAKARQNRVNDEKICPKVHL